MYFLLYLAALLGPIQATDVGKCVFWNHEIETRNVSELRPYIAMHRVPCLGTNPANTTCRKRSMNYRTVWHTQTYKVVRRVERCCVGFNENNSTHMCDPVCVETCVNATCVAPNTCECTSGYVQRAGGGGTVCLPHCSRGCRHGVCTAPEVCSCLSGYVCQRPIYEDDCGNNGTTCLDQVQCDCVAGQTDTTSSSPRTTTSSEPVITIGITLVASKSVRVPWIYVIVATITVLAVAIPFLVLHFRTNRFRYMHMVHV